MTDDVRRRIIEQAKARQGLSDVPPIHTTNDVAHHRLTDAELQRCLSLGYFGAARSDLAHDVVSQFCIPVLSPRRSRITHTPLARRIHHIGRMGSQEQVIRARARWIVAPVAYLHTGRNGAVMDLPGRTVRQRVAGAVPLFCQQSVSSFGLGSQPSPTPPQIRTNNRAFLVNSQPETVNPCRRVVGVPTRTRAETLALRTISQRELRPALDARSREWRRLQLHQVTPGVSPRPLTRCGGTLLGEFYHA